MNGKRGTFNASGSGVEPDLYSPCQHEREGYLFFATTWNKSMHADELLS